MKVCISGINGRMGSYVHNILQKRKGFEVVCGVSNSLKVYNEVEVFEEIEKAFEKYPFDLLVDFTEGDICIKLIKFSLENNVKVISGTTGIDQTKLQELIKLSQDKNVSFAHVPNFAKGASELYHILEGIKDTYKERDIIETHHKRKKDKPSGTALEYAKILNMETSEIESLRVNDGVAAHEIILKNPGEKIIIRHEIHHRDAFLRGFLDTLEKMKIRPYFLLIGLKDFYQKK